MSRISNGKWVIEVWERRAWQFVARRMSKERADDMADSYAERDGKVYNVRRARPDEMRGGAALCACGCGSPVPRRDGSGRPRRYILGHNLGRKEA